MSRSPAQPARALRLLAVFERDGATCIWCGRTWLDECLRRGRPYLDAKLRRLRRRGGGTALPA